MQIRIDNLRKGPRQSTFSEPVSAFPQLVALAEQGDVHFQEPVAGRLEAAAVGDTVRVTGLAVVTAGFSCSRCLADFEQTLEVPLEVCYQKSTGGEQGESLPEELELTLRDMELIPFQGEVIDPAPEIAQEIVMALPQSALCREGCAGLCPVCGQDLNVRECSCEKPVLHAGLARLKDFKVDRE